MRVSLVFPKILSGLVISYSDRLFTIINYLENNLCPPLVVIS